MLAMQVDDRPEDAVFAGEITEDLVPSRSERLDDTISLDFAGMLNPALTLKQDLTEGCGGKTWPAGMLLSGYLLRYKIEQLKGKTMFVRSKLPSNVSLNAIALKTSANQPHAHRLELGSGSGLVGYALHLTPHLPPT